MNFIISDFYIKKWEIKVHYMLFQEKINILISDAYVFQKVSIQ